MYVFLFIFTVIFLIYFLLNWLLNSLPTGLPASILTLSIVTEDLFLKHKPDQVTALLISPQWLPTND